MITLELHMQTKNRWIFIKERNRLMGFRIISAEGTEEKFAWIAQYIKGKEHVVVYSDKNKELAEYLVSVGGSCVCVNHVTCEQESDFLTGNVKAVAFYGKSHSPRDDNVFDHAEHVIIAFMQTSIERLNYKIKEDAECTLLLSKEKIIEKSTEDIEKVNEYLYQAEIEKIIPDDDFSDYYMKAERFFQNKVFKISERQRWPDRTAIRYPFSEGISLSKNNSLGYGRLIENDLREKNLSEKLLNNITEKAASFAREHDIKWITYIVEPQNINEAEFMSRIIGGIRDRLGLPVRDTVNISPFIGNVIPANTEEICADFKSRYSLISENCIAGDVLVITLYAESTYKFAVYSDMLNALYEGTKVYPFSLIEERETYCSFTDNMYDYKKLLEITERRNIAFFTHFTQIANLDSILDKGIVSVYDLNRKNFEYRSSDADRNDNHLEEISVSVSYPNGRMFYSKRRNIGGEWAVMELDPYFVLKRKCNFFRTNAASDISKEIRRQRENNISDYFEEMFADDAYGYRAQKGLPDNLTTDEQAEIMVYRHIPVYAIKKIHFQSREALDRFSEKLDRLGIEYDSSDSLFNTRDYALKNGLIG